MPTDALESDRQSNRQPTSTSRVAALWTHLGTHERAIWALLATVLCADLLSTYYGVQQGLTEGNPIVRAALADGGFAAFTTLKIATVSLGLSVWVAMPEPNRTVVPLGLAFPWTLTTLTNLVTILA